MDLESSFQKLKAIEAIRDNKAVVIVREHEQDKQIVAYYEASQPQSTSHLKEVLSETLPDYMIPIHFKKIDQIPNNKWKIR